MAVIESWAYTLLNLAGEPLGALQGVQPGGKLTLNANADIRGGGKIEVVTEGAPVDWAQHLISISFTSNGHRWPMGTYVPVAPDRTTQPGGITEPIELLDKTSIVAEDTVSGTYQAPAGTVVTTLVKQLVESTGATGITMTPSAETLKSAMTWDPATSKLRIVNDLLDAIGYWALWADRDGQLRIEPYVEPQRRGVTRRFDGARAWHLPTWTRSSNRFKIPNRVVCVSEPQGTDANHEPLPALVGVAENENPDSPFSFPSRGRWISQTYQGVEATSQQVINQIAARRLLEASTPSEVDSLTARHLPTWFNDVAEFDGGLAVVESLEFTMTPGQLVGVKLRRVVPL